MKFVCDQCGKRFASTDAPVPGRTYRIRCRCGHVIVLPPAMASAVTTAPAASKPGPASAAAPPPKPAPRAAVPPPRPAPPPLDLETPTPAVERARAVEHATKGLDDLFASSSVVPIEPGAADPFAPRAEAASADPFAVPAADPFAISATDPFAAAPPPAGDPFAVLDAPPEPLTGDDPFAPPPIVRARRRDPFAGQDPFSPAAAEPAPTPSAAAVVTADVIGPATPTRAVATPDVLGSATPEVVPRPFVSPPPITEREDSGELSLELSMSDETPLPTPAAGRRRWSIAAGLAAAVAVAAGVVVLRGAQGPAVVVTGRAERAPVVAKTAAPVAAPAPAPRSSATSTRTATSTPTATPTATVPLAPSTAPAQPARSRAAPADAAAAASTPAPAPPEPDRRERQRPDRVPADVESTAAVGFESAPAAPALDPRLKEALARKESAPAASAPVRSLDPAEVQAGIARGRPTFDACVADAVAAPGGTAVAGRRTGLLLLVAPSGRAEGVLEDPELAEAPLGKCLARAAARLSFPPFDGEPVAVRVPIVVGAR